MKKLIALSVLAMTVATPALAGFQGGNHSTQQGKSQARGSVSTVAQAKKAYDNARFSISGYIVNQIDEDEFTFKDSTGTIRIDVEDGAWRGLNVGPKDRVRISGKVDVDDDSGRRTLDVYQISR